VTTKKLLGINQLLKMRLLNVDDRGRKLNKYDLEEQAELLNVPSTSEGNSLSELYLMALFQVSLFFSNSPRMAS